MQPGHASQLGASFLFAITAGGWFAYFRLKQRGNRPLFVMLLAIVGGHLSAIASVELYGLLDRLGYQANWAVMQDSWERGVPMSLVIGLVEEGTKLIPVLLILLSTSYLSRSRDGLYLAACAGLGFAAAENVIFFEQGISLVEGVARAVTTPMTHALFAAPWGLGLAVFLLRRRPAPLALGFAASVASHGLYDFLLARPQVPLLGSAAVVLGLWVWMLVKTAPASIATRTRGPGWNAMGPAVARASGSLSGI